MVVQGSAEGLPFAHEHDGRVGGASIACRARSAFAPFILGCSWEEVCRERLRGSPTTCQGRPLAHKHGRVPDWRAVHVPSNQTTWEKKPEAVSIGFFLKIKSVGGGVVDRYQCPTGKERGVIEIEDVGREASSHDP